MWLINTHTWRLEEVWSEEVKTYAILSHRWQEEEVSFKDMQDIEMASKKQGFSKIKRSCDRALHHGYDYVWVDTCCINNESSAELSEAINSMFRWYKRAAVCYAYLSDVDISNVTETSVENQLQQSQCFTRGWTLQELLAPDDVVFYDCSWLSLGTKNTLSKVIQKRTRIHEQALHRKPLTTYSIAQRMAWASQRITTRPEDIAYCLLGIFDVNMPMLYGEGTKAFLRLQEEIIRQSDDHSIFARPINDCQQTGLLAESPDAFSLCQNVRVSSSGVGHSSYTMTNRGLSCNFIAIPFIADTYLARLDCTDESEPLLYHPHLGMFLRRLADDDQYARVRIHGKTLVRTDASLGVRGKRIEKLDRIQVNIKQRILEPTTVHMTRFNGFRVRFDEITLSSIPNRSYIVAHGCDWDPVEMVMKIEPYSYNHMGSLDIRGVKGSIACLKLGFDFSYNPVCLVLAKKNLIEEYMARNRGLGYPEIIKPPTNPLSKPAFDTDGWNEYCYMSDRHVGDVDGHSGFWALKGDRLHGLGAQRLFIGNRSFLLSGRDVASISIRREEIEGSLVWTVDLNNMFR
ncbi:MAG: hypothetical protein Q9198_001384 [Flavoplaca austrocitrina]